MNDAINPMEREGCWLCDGCGEVETSRVSGTPETVGCPVCVQNDLEWKLDEKQKEVEALAAHVESVQRTAATIRGYTLPHQGRCLAMLMDAAEEAPATSLARRDAEQQGQALRAFAEQQRAALENIPARDRYALHPGTSVDGWHHTFAQRADAAADRIDRLAEEAAE